MCRVSGYIGKKEALPIIMDGLRRQSYGGYDSAGVTIMTENGLVCVKAVGKLENLEKKLEGKDLRGNWGIGHCLPPDTLIQLADGRILEISKIINGDKVLALNLPALKFEEAKARIFKHKSPDYLYEIKTPSTSIKTTGSHKMIVFENGGIREKKVEDLSKNDLLIFPKIMNVRGEKIKFKEVEVKRYYQITNTIAHLIKNKLIERELSLTKVASKIGVSDRHIDHIIRNDRNFREDQLQKMLTFLNIDFGSNNFFPVNTIHGKFLNLPKESSPDLMQIIGYFLGDGYAGERYLRFKDEDKETLRIYQGLIEKTFNIKGRIAPMKGTIAFLLEVNSTFLSNWFKENIISRKSDFLSDVGKLTSEEIAAFLRGLFDAEGGNGIEAGQVFLGITNKKLAKIVQFLLLRFGILSSISITERKEKNWNKAYRVSSSNYNSIKKFLDYVGFSSSLKKKKLKTILNNKKDLKRGGTRSFKVIPLLKREIYKVCSRFVGRSILKKFLGSGKYLDYFITERQLADFIEFLKKESSKELKIQKIINNLEKFLAGEVVFQPIVEKKKIKSLYSYLYDLEVTPHSNFIANCLLSHNCRWASHGAVTETNAHPHHDCKKNIYLAHNGIIENYQELKERLIKEGHQFTSDTDTEVTVHLIEKYFEGNLEEAVRKALKEIRGAYGLVIIARDDPQKIVAARLSSPLLIGVNENEYIIASDPTAIAPYARKIIHLEDYEIATITPKDLFIIKEKAPEVLELIPEEAEKGGYPHFMLKEIMEEPEAIENAIRGRLITEEGSVKLGGLDPVSDKLKEINRLILIACGTASFAARVGEYMLEEYAGLPTEVDIGSEFRYRKPIINENMAAFFISQSGETADTLSCLREMKKKGVLTLGITNVVGSSQARETDAGVYIRSGPEIAVASTKAFLGQLATLAMFTVYLGRKREMALVMGKRIVSELSRIPELAREVLKSTPEIEKLAKKYKDFKNFWFIGRKYNYPVALEGALKLKEISYLHAEGVGGGELKHGPLALIDENFPTVAICPSDSVYEKMVSNIEEIKAREGPVIAIATEGNEEIKKIVDDVIYIPKTLEMLTPMLSIIPLHLFAYYMAVLLGCDVDKPRNLSKVITVE